jgi:hypothetical protein
MSKYQLFNMSLRNLLPLLPYVIYILLGQLLQRSLQLFLSVHFCISLTFLQDCPLLSLSLLTWFSYYLHGLPLGLFPLIFIAISVFGILCLSILLTCLNHHNLCHSACFCVSSILSSFLICVFLSLSLFIFPILALKNLISVACILLLFHLVYVHVSAPHNSIFLKYTLDIVVLHFLSVRLFHNILYEMVEF